MCRGEEENTCSVEEFFGYIFFNSGSIFSIKKSGELSLPGSEERIVKIAASPDRCLGCKGSPTDFLNKKCRLQEYPSSMVMVCSLQKVRNIIDTERISWGLINSLPFFIGSP